MAIEGYAYDPATGRLVLEISRTPVARDVSPAHGSLLANAALYRAACQQVEQVLHRPHLSAAARVRVARELLATLLDDVAREEIRQLPEGPAA